VEEKYLLAAIRHLGKTEEFFPRPAKIIQAAREAAREEQLQIEALPEAPISQEEKQRILKMLDDTARKMGWK
jgi:hypothetical protein